MQHQSPSRPTERVERAIGDLASRQFGVVTRAQLLALGIGRGAIAHRVRCGRLRIVHHGVYLVGHEALPALARELAAVLALGEGAVLSHASAAQVWSLVPVRAASTSVEVTVVGRKVGRRPGIRAHRTAALDPRDRRNRGPLPLTAPARTIVDLAASLPRAELEQAIAQARRQRLASESEIRAAIRRAGRRRGIVALTSLLEGDTIAYTRSAAERRMLSLIRDAGLSLPAVNARVAGFEVDFLWRPQRLVIEVDGYRFHADRRAFENDRRRDAELVARGYRVVRITWRRLCDEPIVVAARLAAAQASTGVAGST
jgi:very-short-patch-repair endonuclease